MTKYSPSEFADIIKQKIGNINRFEFFPSPPDILFDYLKTKDEEGQCLIEAVAHFFFESMKLMTQEERQVIAEVVMNTCPNGPPDNVHLQLDLLSRVTGHSKDEVIAMFSRLDCLSIRSRRYESDTHRDEHSLVKFTEIIEFTFEPSTVEYEGNATGIVVAIFRCIFKYLCPVCARCAIDRLDLSVLGSLTATYELHEAQ